jgi:hypothetical protein
MISPRPCAPPVTSTRRPSSEVGSVMALP